MQSLAIPVTTPSEAALPIPAIMPFAKPPDGLQAPVSDESVSLIARVAAKGSFVGPAATGRASVDRASIVETIDDSLVAGMLFPSLVISGQYLDKVPDAARCLGAPQLMPEKNSDACRPTRHEVKLRGTHALVRCKGLTASCVGYSKLSRRANIH
jgi:hypothetical protein